MGLMAAYVDGTMVLVEGAVRRSVIEPIGQAQRSQFRKRSRRRFEGEAFSRSC